MVALSHAEVLALIKYHTGQAKRVTRVFGNEAIKLKSDFFSSGNKLKALANISREQLKGHSDRSNELLKILPT